MHYHCLILDGVFVRENGSVRFVAQGRYDAVVISEAPNDEVVTKFALVTGSLGNVRTETLRAFTEDEYRTIISALP